VSNTASEPVHPSLHCHYRDESILALQQSLPLYETVHEQTRECDLAIEKLLDEFESNRDLNSQSSSKDKKSASTQLINALEDTFRITGVDLTSIPGIGYLEVSPVLPSFIAQSCILSLTVWESAATSMLLSSRSSPAILLIVPSISK
jgi:hypothetical protein